MAKQISLVSHVGIPEDALLSIRAGSVRRQAALSAGKSFKFPKIGMAESPIKIDILQPIGTAYVVCKPGHGNYQAVFQGNCAEGMSCEVEISSADEDEKDDKEAEAAEIARTAQDAKAYLESHSILSFVQAVLQTVVKERPADPYALIARHFSCGYEATELTSSTTRTRGLRASAPPKTMRDFMASDAAFARPMMEQTRDLSQAEHVASKPVGFPGSAAVESPAAAEAAAPAPATPAAPEATPVTTEPIPAAPSASPSTTETPAAAAPATESPTAAARPSLATPMAGTDLAPGSPIVAADPASDTVMAADPDTAMSNIADLPPVTPTAATDLAPEIQGEAAGPAPATPAAVAEHATVSPLVFADPAAEFTAPKAADPAPEIGTASDPAAAHPESLTAEQIERGVCDVDCGPVTPKLISDMKTTLLSAHEDGRLVAHLAGNAASKAQPQPACTDAGEPDPIETMKDKMRITLDKAHEDGRLAAHLSAKSAGKAQAS